MDFANEANEIRALARLLAKGYLYRGLKPVNWCFDCGSALAEVSPGMLLSVPVIVTSILWMTTPNPVELTASAYAFCLLLH